MSTERVLLLHQRALKGIRKSDDPAQAIRNLETRLNRHSDDVEFRYALAMILDEKGPATDALPLCEQVVQERPKWADAQHSLGWTYGMQLGRFPEGIEQMRLATQLDPDNRSHWYGLGAIYLCAGQWQDAKDAFQQCLVRTIPPEEEYIRKSVEGHLRLLDRRLGGDLRPVFPRRRIG